MSNRHTPTVIDTTTGYLAHPGYTNFSLEHYGVDQLAAMCDLIDHLIIVRTRNKSKLDLMAVKAALETATINALNDMVDELGTRLNPAYDSEYKEGLEV